MEKNANPKKKIAVLSSIVAIILVLCIVVNVLALSVFSGAIEYVMGGIELKKGDTSTLDLAYYKSSHDSNALKTAQEELSREIGKNGVVLLEKREGSGYPYAAGTTFSIFSHSSVDWIAGGTGSGGGTSKHTLKAAMEDGGLKVNDTLWNFYNAGNGKSYVRGGGSFNYGENEDYSINECPIDVIKSEAGLEATFKGTTAMFVFSRTGGEGRDLARSMVQHTKIKEDQTKHYLEPDSVELGVIEYLQNSPDINEIVLIVNCNNAVELGWINDYSKIKTVFHVPGTGEDGIEGFIDVLTGKEAPSGRLVDTYAYDAFSSPAVQNFDESIFLLNGQKPDGKDTMFYYYMVYAEGIYVGYKYYETRYEDAVLDQGNAGSYDYATTVQYPFGYGLSLTDFEWSNFNVTESGDEITVTLDVKNAGNIASREVVEIYAQAPYTEGGVEKASVQLVGFQKTGKLAPGASESVTVTVDRTSLMSYDTESEAYILDPGTYYITAAKDAHAAVNNILRVKNPAAELIASPSEKTAGDASLAGTLSVANRETYNDDGKIENRLSDADWTNHDSSFRYLTRSDWEGTFPKPIGELTSWVSVYSNRINNTNTAGYMYALNITQAEYDKIRGTDSGNPGTGASGAPTFSQASDIELVDLRGRSIDDPMWDELISKMSAEDMATLITKNGYTVPKINSINDPAQAMRDGPKGIIYTFPCEVLLAETWDPSLAEEFGKLVGDECLNNTNTKISGWFAPAMNIHRTPFSGRNFEYYSEDGFISGVFGRASVRGAASKGLITFIKHFAFNDNEGHRGDRSNNINAGADLKGDSVFDKSIFAGLADGVGDWGITIWLNEQAAREIFLKPFQMVLTGNTIEDTYYDRQVDDDGNTTYEEKTYTRNASMGLMTSFNRIGATWTGGDYDLITGIVRGEWGFDGNILTDFDNGGYMSTYQMLEAGADCKLSFIGEAEYDGTVYTVNTSNAAQFDVDADGANYHYAKEALKHILYATANSSAMNGVIHGVESTFLPYHYFIVFALDLIALVGIALLIRKILKLVKSK